MWTPPGSSEAQDEFNKILVGTALATLNEVDVICFLVDALKAWREEAELVLDCLKPVRAPVVLAMNKTDLVRNKRDLLPVIDSYHQSHAVPRHCPHFRAHRGWCGGSSRCSSNSCFPRVPATSRKTI